MLANRRGQRVALAGLTLQAGLVALAVGLWVQTRSAPTWAGLWLIVAPAPVWLVTALLFYCRYLRDVEREDLRQLAARGGDTESIFAAEDESQRAAAVRLRWMERYLAPGFSLAFAVYHLALGVLTLQWLRTTETFPASNFAAIFFAIGGAFGAFLMSRYATGMAKVQAWRLLRAPGSYLFANTLVLVVLAVVLGLEYGGLKTVGRVVGYVFSLLLMGIGAELVLNFVLDLYRPRIPDVERRFGYDSRLLNIIASPESIGHSIAEALNYQFGFEVSSSWFYRLLQRAFVPLLLAGAVIVWLMTGIVVVREGQTYVVLHFGKPHRVLRPRPAPHLTWPWPIDIARRFDTAEIHQIVLGVGGPREEEFIQGRRVYLWSEEHGPRNELDTLVAVPPRREGQVSRRGQAKGGAKDTPNVMIIKLVMSVFYRITDPHKFGYDFTDAQKLLEGVAHREMVRYAASATLDERLPADEGAGRPQGLMSFGRASAAEELKRRITSAAGSKGLDLGVEIVRVELVGCHPPKDAANAFEDVIAAERERDRMRYEAEAKANKILSEVAGDSNLGWAFAQALDFLNDMNDLKRRLDQGAKPKELSAAAKEALGRADNELERLEKEIHYQRLLGRVRTPPAGPGTTQPADDVRTITQKLRDDLKGHIDRVAALRAEPDPDQIGKALEAANQRAASLFGNVRGRAEVVLAQARAERWKREFEERALASTFPTEMQIYQTVPSLYRLERLLEVLAKALSGRKKYILAMDRANVEVWVNLEEQAQALTDIPLSGERK